MPLWTQDELVAILAAREIPTITSWNRLEGRPRTRDFARALQAEVRDPLWMLCKQWQLGEFRGEDAGSPAQAAILIEDRALTHYRPGQHAEQEMPRDLPLEAVIERRDVSFKADGVPMALDLRLAMGRRWMKLLGQHGLAAYAPAFVEAFSIRRPDPALPENAALCAHARVWQRWAAAAGRNMDGGALYLHLVDDALHAPYDTVSGVADADKPQLSALGVDFVSWFRRLIEQPPSPEQDAWQDHRLEYQCQVAARSDAEERVLTATEYYHHRLDWYAFDAVASDDAAPPVASRAQSFLPAPVTFDGAPHPRWWRFEEGKTNFGAITPSTTDLAKLLFMEFALVYANDWFLLPHALPAGTISRVRGLSVTNVFGERFWIPPAISAADGTWEGFALFALSGRAGRRTSELLLLPTVSKVQDSQGVESVMFVRDEMANQVWGIERSVRLPTGEVQRGAELAAETAEYHRRLIVASGGGGAADPARTAAHRYRVMSTVPEHWIPFIPVHFERDHRQTRLQRAAMLRIAEGDPNRPQKVRPRTVLLRHGLDDLEEGELPQTFFINEEEVPRAGVIVSDGYQRTRWYGGKVVVWRGLGKHTARGEGSSGLVFDALVPQRMRDAAPRPLVAPGHSPVPVDPENPPGIVLHATPDAVSGWNLHVTLTNFTLAPERASTAHRPGEGHLHVYVNGAKIARAYGEWFHLPPLPVGEHLLKMELSANDHSPFLDGGALVGATAVATATTSGEADPLGPAVEAPADAVPSLRIVVHDDPVTGYNVEIALVNFTVAPEHASSPHVPGEGHLQIAVDGVPCGRVYSRWHHVPRLAEGTHEIAVTLVTNDRRVYALAGTPVQASATVVVESRFGTAPHHGHERDGGDHGDHH